MSISFPGESPEYRMARNRCSSRRSSCAARPRRLLPPDEPCRLAGSYRRTTSFQQARPDGTPD